MKFEFYVHIDIPQLNEVLTKMSKQMDDLIARVAAQKTLDDSIVATLDGLRQQIVDAGTDPAKLQELTDSLQAEQDRMTAAVSAGTPAAPPA